MQEMIAAAAAVVDLAAGTNLELFDPTKYFVVSYALQVVWLFAR